MSDPIQVGDRVETPAGEGRLVEWLPDNTLVVRLSDAEVLPVRHFARADCRRVG